MKYIFFIAAFFCCFYCKAQTDSAVAPPPPDSAAIRATLRQDSVRRQAALDSARQVAIRDSVQQLALAQYLRRADSSRFTANPFFTFSNPQKRLMPVRQWQGKEGLFYGIVVMALFFGLLRNAFGRYLSELFRIFFRSSMRQKASKDLVTTAPLPSLLFNILFLLAGALMAALLLRHFKMGLELPLWLLFLYCLAALTAIYLGKLLLIKTLGWLLRATEATNAYVFVVFTTNKILGILLLPLILGLAFTAGNLYQVFFALSVGLVGLLFLYRYALSYQTVQPLVRIQPFHFLVYILAFEVAPLLLINKLLVSVFG